ncbi:hypothetical protein GCM10009107_07040 [Ideonella azotifigens]|uniref:Uncharacterized protein n=1 Tax=Ideonella azotifigens TaxID=513160 RepID=A0ABN1JMN4_9BURK
MPEDHHIMQKSAQPQKTSNRSDRQRMEPLQEDKGQKFEPFWSAAFGSDRRSQARMLKFDQKR